MEAKTKIYVGQKVYLKPREMGNAYRRSKDVVEADITRVGRKYFDVRYHGTYEIETRGEKSEYTQDYDVFFSEQELKDTIESEYLKNKIKDQIPKYGKWEIELSQLREIAKAFGITTKEQIT